MFKKIIACLLAALMLAYPVQAAQEGGTIMLEESNGKETQTFLKAGDINVGGYVGEAIDYVIEQQLKKVDWTLHVDQFRYHTDNVAWRGEFWGKMMKGAVLGYKYTQDEELYKALEDTVKDIISTQAESGSITTYTSSEFTGWDMWGRKYVMVGLESFYEICKDSALKEQIITALCAHADYILSKVGPASDGKIPINESAGDWQGMPASSILEPMIQLYQLTGEQRYLDFSSYIVEEGGAAAANIFEMAYENELSPFEYIKDWAKAYEMTACFVGLADYATITGNEKWQTAVVNYYKKVAEQEITIAGSGGGDVPSYNVRGMAGEQWNNMAIEQTNPNIQHMQETCVTSYWIILGEKVLSMTDDSTVVDEIEKSLYNALLGALRGEDVPAVSYTASEFLWDYFSLLNGTRNNNGGGTQPGLNSCCPANGHTALLLCAWLQVMSANSGFTVNLYHSGSFTGTTPSGQSATLTIDTEYPAQGNIAIAVTTESAEEFTLRLRIPAWSAETTVKVNGEAVSGITAGEYLSVSRTWQSGDVVELVLDMRTKIVQSPNGEASYAGEYQALVRGPILLARDARFDEGSVFQGVKFKQDEQGYAVVSASETGKFENHMEFEVETESGVIHVTDFASAGATWDINSQYASWLPTTETPDLTGEVICTLKSVGVDAYADTNTDSNNAVVQAVEAGAFQLKEVWNIKKEGDHYRIQNLGTGKYLTIEEKETASEGDNVYCEDYSESDCQLWDMVLNQKGNYQIINVYSGRCLSVVGTGDYNLHLWSDVGSNLQLWTVSTVSELPVLSAVPDANQIGLTWELGEADHFVIYRDGKEIATTTNSYYVDINIAKYNVYKYQVKAVAADGENGVFSNIVTTSDYIAGDGMYNRNGWEVSAYATHSSTQTGNAVDGNIQGSPWISGEIIQVGSWIQVDMKRPVAFNQVILNKDNNNPDAPDEYEIYASMDGQNFEKVADGKWTGGRFYGTDNVFKTQIARYIKVVSKSNKENNWWNIANIDVRLEKSLSRDGWTASAYAALGSNPAWKMLDSDMYNGSGSSWISGEVQHIGDWVTVNTGKAVTFNRVSIYTENINDKPDHYNIQVSDDGENWKDVVVYAAPNAYSLPCNSYGYDTSFATQTAQYIRIAVKSDKTSNWWNISNFALYLDDDSAADTTALKRSGWTAESEDAQTQLPQNIFDTDINSCFTSGEKQSNGQYIIVDMQYPQVFNRITMKNGTEYIGACEIFVSNDKENWSLVASGSGSDPYSVFDMSLQKARYIKLVCTQDADNAWCINDLRVFNEGNQTWIDPIRGDISGDGLINADDLKLLRKMLIGSAASTEEQNENADTNGDGELDVRDLVRLKRVTAQMATLPIKIACLGDSLTEGDYGVYGESGIANVQSENYPFFLSEMLGVEVENFGKCGYTASAYLEYYKSGAVDISDSDIVIIMLGTNGGNDTDTETQGNADYRELVELIRTDAPAARVVLCTPPHATEDTAMSNCGYAPQVEKATKFVRYYSEAEGLALIDVAAYNGISSETESIYQPNDGLHFNAEGYRVLATFIGDSLKALYPELF